MDWTNWLSVGAISATFLLAVAAFLSILQTRNVQRRAKRKDDLLAISKWAEEGFSILEETRGFRLDGQDDARYLLGKFARLHTLNSSMIRASSDFRRSFRAVVGEATDSLAEYVRELERLRRVDDWGQVTNSVGATIGPLRVECQESFTKLLQETGNLLAE